MATYRDPDIFPEMKYGTSSIAVSNFDYTNNYFMCFTGGSISFTGTTATIVEDHTRFINERIYSVNSSNFTVSFNGSEYNGGYIAVPKTVISSYRGDLDMYGTGMTVDLTNIDYTNYNAFLIKPGSSSVTGLIYMYTMCSYTNGSAYLYSIASGTTSVTIPGQTSTTGRGAVWVLSIPKFDYSILQADDIIEYQSQSKGELNFTGYKFRCYLKGSNPTSGISSSSTTHPWGALCSAVFDFTSVADGNITVGSGYGAYLAITNGTGTDIKYNRIMVAGNAGSNSSGSQGTNAIGGNAGLFGGSGSNGAVSNTYYGSTYAGYGATQSAGGAKSTYTITSTASSARKSTDGTFGSGGVGSYMNQYSGYTYYGGAGGNGWYGGGGGSKDSYAGGGGGGSSYLLTSDSYKPTGYFPEWTTYAPLISSGSSSLLNANRTWYAQIVIIETAPSGPYPTSLTLSGQTTSYHVNDTFSFTGTCTANYSDGTSAAVTPTSVSSPDMSTTGIKTVTVTYTEGGTTVTATYDITVTTVSLVSITLSGQTTNYYVGDTFTFTGTCTAHYDDTSSLTVNPTSVSSPDMSTTGNKTITVSYTEGGITATATYTISVAAVEPVSISILNQTLLYYEGDTFYIDGTVEATYNNGTTEDVTAYATASGYNMSQVGQQTVTITWSGLTTTITITVAARTPTSLTAYGVKTAFQRGEPFGFGSGFFLATYNNGSSADVTTQVVATGYNTRVAGTYTVTASYTYNNTTVSTTYTITVTAPVGTTYFNYSDDMILRNNAFTGTVQGGNVAITLDHTKQKVLALGIYATMNSGGGRTNPGSDHPVTSTYATNTVDLATSDYCNDRKLFTFDQDEVVVSFPSNSYAYVLVPASTQIVTSGYAESYAQVTLPEESYDYDNYYYYLFADIPSFWRSSGSDPHYWNGERIYTENLYSVMSLGDRFNQSFSLGIQSGGGQQVFRINPYPSSASFTVTYFMANKTKANTFYGGDNWFVIRIPKADAEPPHLKTDDMLYYTIGDLVADLSGYRFECTLKTSGSSTSNGVTGKATFDFNNSNVPSGKVQFGTKLGSYMALAEGNGLNIAYNRIMVVGNPGSNSGAHAGLFNGSASSGGSGTPGTNNSGYWGTTAEEVRAGWGGWYGGTGGAGSSSYLLTPSSYKPAGYLSNWSLYSPVISNSSSVRTETSYDYFATVKILSIPTYGLRTMNYFTGSIYSKCRAHYYDGTKFVLCDVHYYMDILPSEYQQVSYIESQTVNGVSPYIKLLGFPMPDKTTRVLAKVYMPANSGYLFDATEYSNGVATEVYGFSALPDIGKYRSPFGSSEGVLTLASQSDPFTIDKNMNTTTIIMSDGTTYSQTETDQTFQLVASAYLFGKRESNNTVTASAHGIKLYSLKVYDTAIKTLRANYIPCYRKSDNVVGLYDPVNSRFLTNSGGGNLIAGPDTIPHD